MVDRSAKQGNGPSGSVAMAAVWIFLSVAGVAASLTILFLSMRAVMDIGGYCASGGPYQIATQCPNGVAGLMIASIWGGLIFAFVYGWRSVRARAPNLVARVAGPVPVARYNFALGVWLFGAVTR